ncbi:hypothetical protein FQZ97_729570 [compost metagenome]
MKVAGRLVGTLPANDEKAGKTARPLPPIGRIGCHPRLAQAERIRGHEQFVRIDAWQSAGDLACCSGS